MTASAATAAIATQANVEGATSRFCPAGVHMGKCEPASGLFPGSWGSASNVSSALGSGIAPKHSKGHTETQSAIADSARPGDGASVESEISTKPTWVPPNLPLPSHVCSRASFSPSLPVRSVSPPSAPSTGVGKPDRVRQPFDLAHTDEEGKGLSSSETVSEKPVDGKESVSSKVDEPTPKPSEPPATSVSSPKPGLQNKLENKEISGDLKTDNLNVGTLADKENHPHVTVPSVTENPPEVSTETKLPDRVADASDTTGEKTAQATEDRKSPSAKVKPTPLESYAKENVEPTVTPQPPVDVTPDHGVPAAGEKGPSRLTENTSVIPPFFMPPGHSRMTPADRKAELERIGKAISTVFFPPNCPLHGGIMRRMVSQFLMADYKIACGCPLYWKRAIFLASGGQNDETPVEIDAILKTWQS
ncbi:unnamed protein product [Dibothriocephalus latus]|uniref:Serine/threonine-protein phosphatase 2A regulatory subunit B'' subunit alpha/beta/delta EF-hand domain-containing protein n=1 Tax=Dibothriocephalus latus TaxID=60516 RepID=A0A3P7NJ74_DIBLA|nr:unnamed protein product [Dibothriocephalus latus]